MHIGWPQGVFIFGMALGTGICLARHGEARKGNYSFWTAVTSDVITITLLYYGGFFSQH